MEDLCKLCRSITFENLPPCPNSRLQLGPELLLSDSDGQKQFGFKYHQGLKALKKAARACPLCSLIQDGVNKFVWNVSHGERTGSNGRNYPTEGPKDYRLQITRSQEGRKGFMIWTNAMIDDLVFLVVAVGFCVEGTIHLPKPLSRYI
jgi:hypothetical protein